VPERSPCTPDATAVPASVRRPRRRPQPQHPPSVRDAESGAEM
jgi:hypothetical protein